MRALRQGLTGLPIAFRLGALLLIPLLGVTIFAVVGAAGGRERASAASELRDQAQLVAMLSEASTKIERELDSYSGLREAELFGVDLSALSLIVGLDLDASNVDPVNGSTAVLQQIAGVEPTRWADPDAIEALLDQSRGLNVLAASSEAGTLSSGDIDAISDGLRPTVAEALAAQTRALNDARSKLVLSEELSRLLDANVASQELVSIARDDRRALSSYLLPVLDPTESTAVSRRDALAVSSAEFDAKLLEVRDLLPEAMLAGLDADRTTVAWQSIEQLRDEASSGARLPEEEVSDKLIELAPVGFSLFFQGFERIDAMAELNVELSELVAAQTEVARADAARSSMLSSAIGLGLALGTGLLGFITLRSIAGPMRRLERRAHAITEGDLTVRGVNQRGPRDLRLIDDALDQMTSHLETLSRQTEALAAGRLDDDVLATQVAGPLGASVHGSVHRLRQLTARLEHEATHDQLTGLPNRAALLSLLDRCLTGDIDARVPLGAIMVDLDGFKAANDVLGHPVGDEILVHVAQRLTLAAPGSFVARLGGDEFMIVCLDIWSEESATATATHLVEALRQPIATSGGPVAISGSAGAATTSGPVWLTPTEVLRRVDLALYEAKGSSERQAVVFDQRLHDSLLQSTRVQGELRRALANDEFELHVQAVVNTTSMTVDGFEALLRWHPPGQAPVSPAVFIPIAEQSDLIIDIDQWVLRRGGALLAEWARSPSTAHYSLSLNISGRHVSSPGLVDSVRAAIDDFGFDPARLVIEVTESQLIPNLTRAEDVLRQLGGLGVKLAIDDFGTGYASVAHLRHIAFDRIKIDRTFLLGLDDATERSLATLLVSLGRDLHLDVVAEGVETQQQEVWATESGCTHLQGYRYSMPDRPAEAIAAVLERMSGIVR